MMKKNTKQSENIFRKVRLPKADEQFAVVIEMSGGSRMRATCADGNTRMIRIGGKLKRRMWCRENDLIIIKPWTIQSDKKADLVYIHISIKKDAFSSATNFDQAMKLAALLFGLCDELDGSVTYHSPHRPILNNLFGKIHPYGAGSKILGISEPLKSAIDPKNYNYEPAYFVDLLDVEWVFSSPLRSDIELNFIVPKK